jgi:malonyl-CoA/methylmalonyl-CoA synthetase
VSGEAPFPHRYDRPVGVHTPDGGLHALLRAGFEPALDRAFLTVPGGRRWTYREVDDLSARMAAILVDRGLGVGDRLLVQVAKSPESVALYLAALRAGAVYLPLNTAYTDRELEYFVADAEPAVAVVDPARADGGLAGAGAVLTLDGHGAGTLGEEAARTGAALDPVARGPDDVVAMLYTSGTTGRSKGAMLTSENLASNALALHRIWGWEPGDVLLHVLPIFHVHGLFVALHCAMLNGSEVIFCPGFDATTVRGLLPRATVAMGVPTHYARLLEVPGFGASDCESIRLFTSGSAPMTEHLHRRFAERTGHLVLERYGMTEAGMITSNPYRGERVAGSVGYPLPEVEVRVTDDAGGEVASGVPGQVEVRGPNVFAGYWRMPDKTAAQFAGGGWFRTGDVGSLAHDGRLTLAGRATDMIISGGLNVYPKEIEQALDEVDGVVESAVVGIDHPDLGEAVTAFLVVDGEVSDGELAAAVAPLARFKHPRRHVLVDELPRNAMGKVQKAALRAGHSDLYSAS